MANLYPRRRSIFSGLLLILIGALLLARTLGGSSAIWNVLWRWWPLVFIVWGLAKLYDHFIAQRTGETAPPTISAGEILLVFLLLGVIGGTWIRDWGGTHFDFSDTDWPFTESYSFTEDVPAQKAPANAHIVLRTTRGSITVHAEDAPEIKVSAQKSAHGENEQDAKSRADRVHVAITQSDSDYIVEPQGENDSGGTVAVDLDVRVPMGATINAQTSRGNVDITGAGGNVAVTGQSGDVAVRQTGGDVSIQSHSGSVTVTGAGGLVRVSGRGNGVEVSDAKGVVTVDGEFYGPLRFARLPKGVHFVSRRSDMSVGSLAGRVEINGPGDMTIADAPGDVTLTTSERDLSLENVTGRIHVENNGGNVTLQLSQPPSEPIEVSNKTGDIDITLPAKSNFEVAARADRNGQINCDFSELESKIERMRSEVVLNGTIGSHGPKLQLYTTIGTIRLHKGQ